MTLNQIIKQIKSYGENHPQINHVWFGDFYDKLDDEDVIYPAMFLDINSGNFLGKQLSYSFSIYLLDRHLVETQAEEVLSDMSLIAEDIVALLKTPSLEWAADPNIPVTIFREAEPDFLAGLKLDVTLILPSLNNRCQIP
jgi:hypothetical protein